MSLKWYKNHSVVNILSLEQKLESVQHLSSLRAWSASTSLRKAWLWSSTTAPEHLRGWIEGTSDMEGLLAIGLFTQAERQKERRESMYLYMSKNYFLQTSGSNSLVTARKVKGGALALKRWCGPGRISLLDWIATPVIGKLVSEAHLGLLSFSQECSRKQVLIRHWSCYLGL